ncbi:hypothetical protein BDZ89DRAFT_1134764 [Hymenopellis radicata]|nr:hypothetical protein BDZ89DRAFT_1134764 [Hymenopellis radicata]
MDSERTSARAVTAYLLTHGPAICTPETEESWNKISTGLSRLTLFCNGGAYKHPELLILALRPLGEPINSAMKSERTQLSGAAIDFVAALAEGLGKGFAPFLTTFLSTLLSLCARTNKIVVNHARVCILVIVENTQLLAILPLLMQAAKDKSTSLRVIACEAVLRCLCCFNPSDLEKQATAKDVEALIKCASRDANADVRKLGGRYFKMRTSCCTPIVLQEIFECYNNEEATRPIEKDSVVVDIRHPDSELCIVFEREGTCTSQVYLFFLTLDGTRSALKDPIRPPRNAATNNGQSSNAMAPPSKIPIRPTLPSKASTSSVKDALKAGPTRPPDRRLP